jgi:mannose-6-phosphate isomerase-like protein (cupin superfamily)
MKLVRAADLTNAHEVPDHYDMKSLDIHGMEPEGYHNILILGLSQFLPGGGARKGEIKADVIYYVLEGEMTVINAQGEAVIRVGDSVRFEKNEVREIVNKGNMTAKMLVIAGIPK